MDPEPEVVTVTIADSLHCSDEEGDALIPQHAVKRVQSKQYSLVWKITLFLCPYLFGILFLTMFAAISCFCFLSAPIVTILNALPVTKSVVIDLKEISSSLYQNGNGKVYVQEANQHYSYGYPNYLFTLPPNSEADCSLKFCFLEPEIKPDYYKLYSVESSSSVGCVTYLSGNNTSIDDIIGLSKVSFAPQICQSNKFIGINLNLSETLCSPPYNQMLSLCNPTFIKNEAEATHQVATGLYKVIETTEVSLPHYSYSESCRKIDPETSIRDDSRILIESASPLSKCFVVVSTEAGFKVYIPLFVSAFCIILFLTACDFSSWIFKRLLKVKFE